MGPEARRRLELSLNDDTYTCERCCSDLPYTIWNTCPLCLCGLMPVLVVCFSAVFRLDYATHVTDIGAKIINEMGLSYTVYYTAGCWPTSDEQAQPLPQSRYGDGSVEAGSLRLQSRRCNSEQFEIAAGEFDALSGSLLRVRNVTQLHARRVEVVKVSPDWRYIVFVASLANDIGMLYAVGAEETNALKAVPLLHEKQLDALDAQCQEHSAGVLEAARFAGKRKPLARLAGYKHLQVIIPGVDPSTHVNGNGEGSIAQQVPPGSSPRYRAAFAFECAEPGGPFDMPARGPGIKPLRFSKLALLDFQLHGLDVARRGGPPGPGAHARSELRILDTVPAAPADAGEEAREAISRFRSQCCPRFVPSKQGSEVLFVAEDLPMDKAPTPSPSAWLPSSELPSRRLGLVAVPPAAWEAAQPPVQPSSAVPQSSGAVPPVAGRTLAEEVEEVKADGSSEEPEKRHRRPAMCCRALTADCMACVKGVSKEEFCAEPVNAGVAGCERTKEEKPSLGGKVCCRAMTAQCLACTQGVSEEEFCRAPKHAQVPGCRPPAPNCCERHEATCLACLEGKSVVDYCRESGKHWGVPGCEQSPEDLSHLHLPPGAPFSVMALQVDAVLLNVGLGALPFAPVHGCPEFVPTLYFTSQNLAETFRDHLFNRGAKKEAEAQLAERRFRDTFVILSDPTSASVLGVDAQVLAVSLPEGPVTGSVSRVHLLYNVGNAPGSPGLYGPSGRERLRLGGCGPIRAAGRQGHMRLQSVVETLMATLNLHTEKSGYTAWLACLTADQRVAIVESPKREHWINMSMPYPMWTGKQTQAIWCPEEREEACFEVWSNPNPNE